MPVERVPVVHKFGIISHTQRLALEDRLARKSLATEPPRTFSRTRWANQEQLCRAASKVDVSRWRGFSLVLRNGQLSDPAYKTYKYISISGLLWYIKGLITVFDAISTGKQSGQKLQCLYGNTMANNIVQNWILDNLWIVTLKNQGEHCIHQVWRMYLS